MRYFLLALGLLIPHLSFAQEEIEYTEYSYSELFQMIEDEEDSVFELNYAEIKFDPKTDEQFNLDRFTMGPKTNRQIIVDKELLFRDVFFDPGGSDYASGLINITFNKRVRIYGSYGAIISSCQFKDEFWLMNLSGSERTYDKFANQPEFRFFVGFALIKNTFNKGLQINSYSNPRKVAYTIHENKIESSSNGYLIINGDDLFQLHNNTFSGKSLRLTIQKASNLVINQNTFDLVQLELDIDTNLSPDIRFTNNTFSGSVLFETKSLSPEITVIDWDRLPEDFFGSDTYGQWYDKYIEDFPNSIDVRDSLYGEYWNPVMLEKFKSELPKDQAVFKQEISNLGKYYRLYKDKHDTEYSNAVYVKLKDLETRRFEYLYSEAPSFKSFFTWKINQFLKVFSAYGTEPARAIVFSVYVILAFALVYLFFPNYWDSHGKDRILHRYQFFLKYLNRDAGMHEVYLDEKRDELAHYEGFKSFFEENGKTAPRFFLATALPIYRWSTASTRSSSWLLRRVDIFKGKWQDLPRAQKALKTVLLAIVFLLAILYDLFIKVLNALMLSINTFTTLGFGEIPIKGLPRYLAIIQGFIGWFMLTIFSVSLISQLLN